MSNKILCVRIAQRVIWPAGTSQYNRFPFDRVYLGKKEHAHMFKQLFRYHLLMELDQPLLDALGQLAVKTIKKTSVIRDDIELKGVPATHGHNHFLDHIANASDWLMVVPSHVVTVYKDPKEHTEPIKSELAYVLSNAIKHQHNQRVRLPQITLVTPTRTIPILCGMCRRILDLHAGNCVPGQSSCKYRVQVRLKYDDHNSYTAIQPTENPELIHGSRI